MHITVLTTGGTIDGLEYPSEDLAPNPPHPILPSLLKQANITADYELEPVVFKDSKFITDSDRELIYQKCEDATDKNIIVTHGTATMAATAKFLRGKKLNKVIVLVGSMVLATEPDNDALFNLGSAFIAVQLLEPGVYIAMNGRIFEADNVRKNSDKSIFEQEKLL